MIDITTHCAHVHLQASGQFWTSDGCSGLQQFKHSENATGWMIHDKPLLSATFLSILLKQGAIPPSFQHMLLMRMKSSDFFRSTSVPLFPGQARSCYGRVSTIKY